MTSLLRRLGNSLRELWDTFLLARYINSVCEYARRRNLLPVTAGTLARFILVDEKPDRVSALLAAYKVTVDPARLAAIADPTKVSDDASLAVAEIVSSAYYIARDARDARRVEPAELLVALARHATSAATLRQLGLTELQITYFLSHGRPLPPTRNEELPEWPQRPSRAFVSMANDHYTPMALVMTILIEIFGLETAFAQDTMLEIHRQGERLLGPYPYEEARTRAAQAIAIAREAGAPLLVSLAKDRTT